MIIKRSFLSIPIYVCSYSDFHKRIEEKRLKSEKNHKDSFAYKKLGVKYEHNYERTEWKYDKIIGWIELYLNGNTIKADYWFIKAQRIGLNLKNKEFEYRNKIVDVSVTHSKNNKEIIGDIKLFLENCQKGKYLKKLKKYFIDTSEFLQLSEFLDIKGLVEKINK
jgi:hypothetical protein